ncbi:hypothetical protein ACFX2J_009416 [Malus domestica]
MKPTTFSSLSIVSLDPIRSKRPNDMSHVARLALRPFNPRPQPRKLPLALTKPSSPSSGPATTPYLPMPSRLLAPPNRRVTPPRRLPYDSTIQEEDKEN